MKVLARITLLSTEEGGRTEPLVGSFRPNHSFQPGTFAIGQVEQGNGTALAPGDSADLVVHFLPGVPKVTPGREWKLYDGPGHLIGLATVLKILEN